MSKSLREQYTRRIKRLQATAEFLDRRLNDEDRPVTPQKRVFLEQDLAALTWAIGILNELRRRGILESVGSAAVGKEESVNLPSSEAARHLEVIRMLAGPSEVPPGAKNRDLILARQRAMRWALHKLSDMEADEIPGNE
jgi:hypothetical protein